MVEIVKGMPFQLPDGTVILPEVNSSGSNVLSVAEIEEQETEREVVEEISKALENVNFDEYETAINRTLADVPVDHKTFTVHMALAAMTAWGLPDFAIGAILGTDEATVVNYKNEEIHKQLLKQIVDGIRYAETSSIHGYLSQQAKAAAVAVATELKSRDPDRRIAAAKDILDRTGFRPADRVEHVHAFEDELRITITKQKEVKPITLDI